MAQRDILEYRIGDLKNRPVFPKVYDGFLEIDELAKAEDGMLTAVRNAVLTIFHDKLLSTAGNERLAEYESKLGLSGDNMTLEDRRQQIVDLLNESKVFNEESLKSLIEQASNGVDIVMSIDRDSLEITLTSQAAEGEPDSVRVSKAIQSTIPQSMQIISEETGTESESDMVYNLANLVTVFISTETNDVIR